VAQRDNRFDFAIPDVRWHCGSGDVLAAGEVYCPITFMDATTS
jgi:hypothetical protein